MELSRLFQNNNGVESDEIRELNTPKNYCEFFQRLEEKMNEKRITQKKKICSMKNGGGQEDCKSLLERLKSR